MKKVNHPESKRFKETKKKIDQEKTHSIDEAIKLAKETATVKFDSGVEVHIKLNINPKKTDQQIRSSVTLPHGNGKKVKIAVIAAEGDQQKNAKAAGADLIGEKDLIENIKKGQTDFDILVATPDAMKLLGPVAKILGPKGLMPNPKDGTVTNNVGEAVSALKKGKISYKNDDSANVHVMIGKVSFEDAKLAENFFAFVENVKKAKPSGIKGNYIKNITIATSMGPSIKVEITQ